MKKSSFLLVLFALCSLPYALAQQYGWMSIAGNLPDFPRDTAIINNGQDTLIASLRSLYFLDDNEGWLTTATIDTGVILHTIDGGGSWEIQTLPFVENICAIEMITPLKGYAASHENSIFRTSDGGNTWEFHGSTFALSLADMDFPPNSDTGYACGQNGALFRITPEGIEDMYTGSISNKAAIHFISPNQGWVCGESVVQEYKNGEWVAGHAYPSGFWHDIFFIDSLHGWGTGYWYTFSGSGTDTTVIVNTTNDADWLPLLSNIGNHPLYKLFFLDHQKGWVTGATGIILSTQDGGQNWTREAEGMSNDFLSGIQFTSATSGYVCGNNMTLLKYGPLTCVNEEEQENILVWPNPTNGKFKIQSRKLSGSKFKIDKVEIVDIYGKVLESSDFQSDLPIGEGNQEFDISSYPAGIYFVRISLTNSLLEKKIVKL
jgi:photosystem II stability/assembly factor-like uncharacterized protein